VILLRHGLAEKNLHAGAPDRDAVTGSLPK
jgi:hypothetical protein